MEKLRYSKQNERRFQAMSLWTTATISWRSSSIRIHSKLFSPRIHIFSSPACMGVCICLSAYGYAWNVMICGHILQGSGWYRQDPRPSLHPDRPFHNFRASRAGDRRISCSSGTSCEGNESSKIGIGSVGTDAHSAEYTLYYMYESRTKSVRILAKLSPIPTTWEYILIQSRGQSVEEASQRREEIKK